MWKGTRRMAEAIAEGIKSVDQAVEIKLHHSGKHDKNDIITDVFKSKMVVFGSPTINKGIASSLPLIFEMMKGLEFKNKKGAAFGTYGWSGESVKVINQELEKAGLTVVNEGIKALWNPDEEALEKCREFGKTLADC